MLPAARTRRAPWMAASLTVMRFSVMKSWRLVHESGRPICHQSLACLNASSCANDAASAPKFDANCSAMMPICRPGSLPFPPPCKATNQFGPAPLQARLRPTSRVLQSPPPRIPPAAPLEWSRTTTRARPFGLAAQAQRGSSLVLRLGLASGICCARVILPQVRGLILKGRGCMEKHKLIRLGANLQRISLEIAISIPEYPKSFV